MSDFKLSNFPSTHTNKTNTTSALTYLQNHLPAITEAAKNGKNAWNTTQDSTSSVNIEVPTASTSHHNIMARFIDGLKKITSESLGYDPLKPGTKQELEQLDGFRRVMGTEKNVSSIHPRSLIVGSQVNPEVMEERMGIAMPILSFIAVVLLLVGLYILCGKVKVWLGMWRKEMVLRRLEREGWERQRGWDRCYGTIVVAETLESESEDGMWV